MSDLVGLLRSLKAAWAERMEAHPAFAAPSLISALEEAATALEAKDKEIEALRSERDSYARIIADIVRAIPLKDALKASATTGDLVSYFKNLHDRAETAERSRNRRSE
jgi:hypothetical protein